MKRLSDDPLVRLQEARGEVAKASPEAKIFFADINDPDETGSSECDFRNVVLEEDHRAWVTIGETRIVELERALRQAKMHLANAVFLLNRNNPTHHWMPHLEKGLREAKAALGEKG